MVTEEWRRWEKKKMREKENLFTIVSFLQESHLLS